MRYDRCSVPAKIECGEEKEEDDDDDDDDEEEDQELGLLTTILRSH